MGFFGKLFGFEIEKDSEKEKKNNVTIVPPETDGSTVIESEFGSGGAFSHILNLGADVKDEIELIKKYRAISLLPEVENAVDDIVNEAIVTDEKENAVSINLDKVENLNKSIKNKITNEFKNILKLLNFQLDGHDILKRFYVDGRLYYDKIVDPNNLKKGILELRQIDSLTVKKIKEVIKTPNKDGVSVEDRIEEYFIYTPMLGVNKRTFHTRVQEQLKVSSDRITFIHSGIIDSDKKIVLSYIHKAIKPINQLQLIEDSTVIYRLSRAPERRVFYIDVGTLPAQKAESYLRKVMNEYKNKVTYDSNSGQVVNQRHHLSMMEDFFLPRREGGRGTEIDTVGGNTSLGNNEEVEYFKKKLYSSLNVPISRTESDNAFNIGRSAEISRDEIKFFKFITRLRNRFSGLFEDILGTQLVLKGIMKQKEWESIKQDVVYDYLRDSHFTELKESEIFANRLELLQSSQEFIGTFFSNEYMKKHVLKFNDKEIAELKNQIKKEKSSGEINQEDDSEEDNFVAPPEPSKPEPKENDTEKTEE